MSNNKQSSVELLIEQLEEKGELRDCTSLGLIQLNIDKNDYLALKEKAKAMHKEEIINSMSVAFNNKQSIKIYTEEEVIDIFEKYGNMSAINAGNIIDSSESIELPSDEEIEEKLNVAYGNGYEQGEMDFYKKMQVKGDKHVEGYSEGYKRALELVKWKIDNELQGGNNEQQ